MKIAPCHDMPRGQSGQTLISMLIGVLISLVTIAGMMAIYKTMVDVSANASMTAQRDGQVSSALLAAQIQMQDAGFGVAATDAEASKLSVSSGGKQIVWRYKRNLTDTTYSCAGLRVADDPATAGLQACATPASAEADHRGLYLLPAQACASAADTLDWSCPVALAADAAFFVPTQKDGAANEVGGKTLSGDPRFVEGTAACLPFAQQAESTAMPESRTITLRAGIRVLFTACLPNIAPGT